jgi:UDP-N-acetylglucosamine--N-acetylmuramyl-(pentapeptide) pyrophosphoryl-undecaprenol N-acetylglucosamine transferase
VSKFLYKKKKHQKLMWSPNSQHIRVILSGGGTGGHIFPAIAVANELLKVHPQNEVLFIGAKGRMEMQKVPEAGFQIIGLNIRGLQRQFSWQNLLLPFRVLSSFWHAVSVLRQFKPHCAIGFGGYASGPTLFAARWLGVPYMLQEQNSYAGLTNKLVAAKAKAVFVAYPGMEKYFNNAHILYTGNPVRSGLEQIADLKTQGLAHFGLAADKKVVLLVGGSLGARTINQAADSAMEKWQKAGIQVIWQTGKSGYESAFAKWGNVSPGIKVLEFIKDMPLAYAAADVVVSRAGALTVSELCMVGKPAILIPSPNVAEDHQTKNAQALASVGASLLIPDKDAIATLGNEVAHLLNDSELANKLAKNIKSLAKPEATTQIVEAIYQMLNLKPLRHAA